MQSNLQLSSKYMITLRIPEKCNRQTRSGLISIRYNYISIRLYLWGQTQCCKFVTSGLVIVVALHVALKCFS